MDELTHLDDKGHATMVDVSSKADSARVAVASGRVILKPTTLALIGEGAVPKGDVFAVARIAGIMAAKRTSELIPLCHPLPITSVSVELKIANSAVEITSTVSVTGKTGVEMEALTAASVAALTIYDMVKAVDRSAVITDIRLESKSGGKSGEFIREQGSE